MTLNFPQCFPTPPPDGWPTASGRKQEIAGAEAAAAPRRFVVARHKRIC